MSAPWSLEAGQAPDERHHRLLVTTSAYDAWLIYWPPGSGLEAHDHGGSAGAVALIAGELDEDSLLGDLPVRRRIERGRPIAFGAEHIHAVVNRGDQAATSVHVYAPPLQTMAYYRRDDGGALVVDRVDPVAVAP